MPISAINFIVIVSETNHLINTTHLRTLEKVLTHSLKGFGQYIKQYLIEKYSERRVQSNTE